MTKRKILIQLDPDRHPSSFDRVVAVDAGAEELFAYGGVQPEDVEGLVHGAMFTRGPADLNNTAFFIGGKNFQQAEQLLDKVNKTYFGHFRCSVMLDPNGANTTAAAIVLTAKKHLDLAQVHSLVLGGTGPVGMRVALLLARLGGKVSVGSRSLDRANEVCERIRKRLGNPNAPIQPVADISPTNAQDVQLAVAAGAAAVRLLDRTQIASLKGVRVLIDANAVPPSGIEGVEAIDRAREADGLIHYGALGVGGLKMKIHKAAIASLFESNDRILDSETIYDFAIASGLN